MFVAAPLLCRLAMNLHLTECVHQALDGLDIELPSWGFADTGTRFGKFHQEAAAIDIYDKIKDAATVHRLTKACSKIAVHVLWDFWGFSPKVMPHLAFFIAKIAKHGGNAEIGQRTCPQTFTHNAVTSC